MGIIWFPQFDKVLGIRESDNALCLGPTVTLTPAQITTVLAGTGATLGANTFTRQQTITQGTANEGVITSTGYSVTGSGASNMLDFAGTWNTSGAPTGLKINITDTTSDAASMLADLRVGNNSQFYFRKDGRLWGKTFYFGSSTVNWQVGYDGANQLGLGADTCLTWKSTNNLNAGGTFGPSLYRGSNGSVVGLDGQSASFPGLKRNGAALQIRLADDSANAFYQWAGQARVSTQFDKTTNTTASDVTGLSIALAASKTYRFKAKLHVSADATGGHKYAVACSSAPTSIVYQINSINNSTSALVITSRQTSSGGTAGQAGATAAYTEIEGTVTTNAACNLTVQFAQNASNLTSSVLVGSNLEVHEY